jgi:hypothetical protein
VFQHIDLLDDRERAAGILLHQQHGGTGLLDRAQQLRRRLLAFPALGGSGPLQKRYEQQSNSCNHQQNGAAIGAGECDDFC